MLCGPSATRQLRLLLRRVRQQFVDGCDAVLLLRRGKLGRPWLVGSSLFLSIIQCAERPALCRCTLLYPLWLHSPFQLLLLPTARVVPFKAGTAAALVAVELLEFMEAAALLAEALAGAVPEYLAHLQVTLTYFVSLMVFLQHRQVLEAALHLKEGSANSFHALLPTSTATEAEQSDISLELECKTYRYRGLNEYR